MGTIKEQFIVDADGQRTGVVLSISDYEQILDQLDELDAIRAYDEAKASGEEAIPFEDAVREIDQRRLPAVMVGGFEWATTGSSMTLTILNDL